MDPWQKEHVRKYLPELIELIQCSPNLIAILFSKDILGDNDVDILATKRKAEGQYAQTEELIRIAKTRINAYKELTCGLYSTNQSGAYNIFARGYMSHGLSNPIQTNRISLVKDIVKSTKWIDLSDELQEDILSIKLRFMGNMIALNKILAKLPHGVMENILTPSAILDLLNDTSGHGQIEINSNIPDGLKYYVNRRLQPRTQLNTALFKLQSNDVFVVKFIERSKLTEMANGRSTDTSSNQTNQETLTVRFILLEYEEDFEELCELADVRKQPLHLLEYRDQGFYWVCSHGSIDNIQHLVLETEETLSEDEFVLDSMGKPPSQAVCISDTPGMGKTALLANLGRGILKEESETAVIYVVLREFVQRLQEDRRKVETKLVCEVLAKQGSKSEFGQKILKECLLAEKIPCVVLFDGYDEVLTNQIKTTRKIMQIMLELSNTKMIVTTRPHMREDLEKLLYVFGSNIQPFQDCDQVQFLERFWEERGGHRNAKLKQFANICLSKLKEQITDFEKDFAGIPLQCKLLAEVHYNNALKYSNPGSQVVLKDLPVNISVTSVFQLYERLMNMRFEKSQHLIQHHISLAMELLFPEWVERLHLRPKKSYSVDEVCKVGVVERKEKSDLLRFVHRTGAEFLVAKFVVETGSRKEGFFSQIWKPSNNEFWNFFTQELMSTVEHSESILNPSGLGKLKQVASSRYKYPVIAYFINSFLKNKGELANARIHIPQKFREICDPQLFLHQVSASVCHDFQMLTSSFVDFDKNVPRAIPSLLQAPSDLSNLLLLCAKHGSKDSFDQLCHHIEPGVTLQSHIFQFSSNPDFMITPLHVAVHMGKYNFVEHLVTGGGYTDLGQIPFLVHICVFRSSYESMSVVSEKAEIIRLLHSINPKHIEERLTDDTTPLLQLHVHVDLLRLLIDLGADINAFNKENESILHTALAIPKWNKHLSLTTEEYGSLVRLLEKKGHNIFNKRANGGNTALHVAIRSLEMENDTIDCFVRNDANVNAVNEEAESILLSAIKCGRSKQLLIKLIEVGADVNYCNSRGENVLHVSAKYGNVDGLHLFSKKDAMNVTDYQLNTPLHHALMETSGEFEKVQQFLLERGSDVNFRNGSGHVPLVHGMLNGRGVSMWTISLMEKHGLQLSTEESSMALKHHFVNRSINKWGHDWVEVADHLMSVYKGRLVTGNDGQSPLQLEEVQDNMARVEAAILWNGKFMEALRNKGMLCKGKEKHQSQIDMNHYQENNFPEPFCICKEYSSNVNAFLTHIKNMKGAYERLLCSLMEANQRIPFHLLRQCFQSYVNGSSHFVTPPPGMIEFLENENAGVLILLSKHVETTVARIQGTLDREILLLRYPRHPNKVKPEAESITVVLSSAELTRQYTATITGNERGKVILIASTTQVNASQHIVLSEDNIRLADLVSWYRQKLLRQVLGDVDSSTAQKFCENLYTPEIIAMTMLGNNLDNSANIYSKDLILVKGETMLHVAAKYGNVEAAKLLVHSHANVNVKATNGDTPLHCAVMKNTTTHEETQILLIESGAYVKALNDRGHDPLTHGILYGAGVSMRVIKTMEKYGLNLKSEQASKALNHHIANKNMMEWGMDWVNVTMHLIQKGDHVSGRTGESPWVVKEVRAKLAKFANTIEWNEPLFNELRKRKLVNERIELFLGNQKDTVEKLRIYLLTWKDIPGSFELLLCSLIGANQLQAFQLLRQGFQDHISGSSNYLRKKFVMALGFVVLLCAAVALSQIYTDESLEIMTFYVTTGMVVEALLEGKFRRHIKHKRGPGDFICIVGALFGILTTGGFTSVWQMMILRIAAGFVVGYCVTIEFGKEPIFMLGMFGTVFIIGVSGGPTFWFGLATMGVAATCVAFLVMFLSLGTQENSFMGVVFQIVAGLLWLGLCLVAILIVIPILTTLTAGVFIASVSGIEGGTIGACLIGAIAGSVVVEKGNVKPVSPLVITAAVILCIMSTVAHGLAVGFLAGFASLFITKLAIHTFTSYLSPF